MTPSAGRDEIAEARGPVAQASAAPEPRTAQLHTLRGVGDVVRARPHRPPPPRSGRHELPSPGEAAADDPAVTEPSLSLLEVGDEIRVDVQLPRAPQRGVRGAARGRRSEAPDPRGEPRFDTGEWSSETPILSPASLEPRARIGQPDATRLQPADELARLQREASAPGEAPQRRSAHPTAEVDPDDIEAAIELAPPARRPGHPHAIAAIKPRKPEPR